MAKASADSKKTPRPKAKARRSKAGGKAASARKTEVPVKLGHVAANGIAPSLYGLIERGAARRPRIARGLSGTVEIRFKEDFAPVRVAFDGRSVLVEDRDGETKGSRPDLVIQGSLPDIVQLAAAPLVGGLPKPTDRRGRAALVRVANRRVKIEGSPLLARRLLRLLEI
jgi:hypothetical protein